MQQKIRLSALASGSSGNAFLLEAGDTRVLFDAGLNSLKIEQYLRLRGIAAGKLSAIFVSHEHIDHVRGVGGLARRYTIPVVASEGTFKAGNRMLGWLANKITQAPGAEVKVGDVLVRSFSVSHDATQPVGFWIEAGGKNIVICTDLGCETASIREPIAAADLLVLEANHDIKRLWSGPYPITLKKRVASAYGHLSNEDAARLVAELAQDGRRRDVWLAHLSQTNNTPDLAHDTIADPLQRDDISHINLTVLERDHPSAIWDSAISQGI